MAACAAVLRLVEFFFFFFSLFFFCYFFFWLLRRENDARFFLFLAVTGCILILLRVNPDIAAHFHVRQGRMELATWLHRRFSHRAPRRIREVIFLLGAKHLRGSGLSASPAVSCSRGTKTPGHLFSNASRYNVSFPLAKTRTKRTHRDTRFPTPRAGMLRASETRDFYCKAVIPLPLNGFMRVGKNAKAPRPKTPSAQHRNHIMHDKAPVNNGTRRAPHHVFLVKVMFADYF